MTPTFTLPRHSTHAKVAETELSDGYLILYLNVYKSYYSKALNRLNLCVSSNNTTYTTNFREFKSMSEYLTQTKVLEEIIDAGNLDFWFKSRSMGDACGRRGHPWREVQEAESRAVCSSRTNISGT